MIHFKNTKIAVVLAMIMIILAAVWIMPGTNVDYNSQVKPILNKRCINCHGGVKQKGNFSLLFREEALQKGKSGRYPIVPGSAAQSELIRRIKSTDPEERMPFKHDALPAEEIRVLEKWINQGANWGTHWAYQPIQLPKVPRTNNRWVRNNIDEFVAEKLSEKSWTPAVEADKSTLIRRLALDLTGLQPDSTLAQKFLNDAQNFSYEKVVQVLLADSAYGEKWASMWLDIARFADTKGFESDQPREIWRYRDWVIKAFNNDLPYNQFLIDQLAGDLLPEPNEQDLIATAFHRNSMTNDEGGTINEEYRTAAVIDRVNTTWSALMGTTFSCVQCHSHPYDPFKHEEYYKFLAFFNNTADADTESDYPKLRHFAGADSLDFLNLQSWLQSTQEADAAQWFTRFTKTLQPVVYSQYCDRFNNGVLFVNNYASLENGGSFRMPSVELSNRSQLIFKYLNKRPGSSISIFLDSLSVKPWAVVPVNYKSDDWQIVTCDLPPVQGRHHLYFRLFHSPTQESLPLLLDWFAFAPAFPGKGKKDAPQAFERFLRLVAAKSQSTPIMLENEPWLSRKTFVFERGSWLAPAQEVKPGVPAILNPMPANESPNRLGLAHWMTDVKNPLTARTIVNRIWEQIFGTGLAETIEDMGSQGLPPTNKALLDYLSWQLMHEYQWSIKKLIQEIVTSATYRQTSAATSAQIAADPTNQYLGRMSRIRLTGEQIRDASLGASGLISRKMYGPSVMPYQPEGIWSSPYNPARWIISQGGDQYRRAVYIFAKRTAPYPMLLNFDGASREVCTVRRIRTNTPLQALNSLNDSAFLVMARSLAGIMFSSVKNDPGRQISIGYQRLFFKPIPAKKQEPLWRLYDAALKDYQNNPKAAALMAGSDQADSPKRAALVVVASALFNLDEWITKN